MALRIKKNAPTVWLLVKVPKITADHTFGDHTTPRLREAIREHHFGGERAGVRRLTEREIKAIEFVRFTRPIKATPCK